MIRKSSEARGGHYLFSQKKKGYGNFNVIDGLNICDWVFVILLFVACPE